MRTFEDIHRRWTSLFNTSIGVDLRQALRDGEGFDPCEDGLRSVCWKAFLLYGPLSQGSWSKKLAESRSAYVSLRDHFLRFIEHPNDLHSSADPLADDDTSPWATLRQDEISREEVFQDVTRCMQDNYFFREPATQKKLLDILFIYAKLNPDIGYRQGMHELLAPILWVIHQDAVDVTAVPDVDKQAEGTDFMIEALDAKFVEHDAFNLFCAVMQTAKAFYEMGENRDSSPIVARSKKIHDEMLTAVDPELALHLHVIGILPQIYSIRWIRLLFGREFEFKEVLRIWDLIFAENLRSDVVDFTCVAMLLRARWSLVGADYTTAITALTHYNLPHSNESPRSLVKDAVFLEKNRTIEAGGDLIQRYSGRRPKQSDAERSRSSSGMRAVRTPQHRNSPSASPGRFASHQKQLEGLFQEVTGNLQKRTEGWNVSKAVRSAVGEVRRNMNTYQNTHSRQSSLESLQAGAIDPPKHESKAEDPKQNLQRKIHELQERNTALARMLDSALESLRAIKMTQSESMGDAEQSLNISMARIQFVSVYLSDPDIPIPKDDMTQDSRPSGPPAETTSMAQDLAVPSVEISSPPQDGKGTEKPGRAETNKHANRPSLMDSSFSFMLGENRHRSSFVSSVADLPEQRRDSESKGRPKQLSVAAKAQQDRRESESEDDGFTLTKIHGAGRG